jgi:hypothetical protein
MHGVPDLKQSRSDDVGRSRTVCPHADGLTLPCGGGGGKKTRDDQGTLNQKLSLWE